jgi:ABC-type uncharacterized transport system substrate-binding protein
LSDGFITSHRATIIAAADRNKVPTIAEPSFYTRDGGLLSYRPNFPDMLRKAAGYVNRILKGEKPADLPVQLPTKYDLTIPHDQSQDHDGARPYHSTKPAPPRRRGDRMKRREFIAGIGAAAWPLTARAAGGDAGGRVPDHQYGEHHPNTCSVSQGLAEQGFVEGQNVEILSRYAETHEDRMPALAADLVQRRVAALGTTKIVSFARIAKNATAIIPIVFSAGGDPVESGLVANLNRPGGNVTGATFLAIRLVAKRLEILHQIVPTAASIGYLINPNNPQLEDESREVEAATHSLGVRVVLAKVSTGDEIGLAVASLMEQKVGAMLSAADTCSSFLARC